MMGMVIVVVAAVVVVVAMLALTPTININKVDLMAIVLIGFLDFCFRNSVEGGVH